MVSIAEAYWKGVMMAHQPFHLEEFISPLVFCLLFQQLVLYEICSLEIVKTCNSPNFQPSSTFMSLRGCKQAERITITPSQLEE